MSMTYRFTFAYGQKNGPRPLFQRAWMIDLQLRGKNPGAREQSNMHMQMVYSTTLLFRRERAHEHVGVDGTPDVGLALVLHLEAVRVPVVPGL